MKQPIVSPESIAKRIQASGNVATHWPFGDLAPLDKGAVARRRSTPLLLVRADYESVDHPARLSFKEEGAPLPDIRAAIPNNEVALWNQMVGVGFDVGFIFLDEENDYSGALRGYMTGVVGIEQPLQPHPQGPTPKHHNTRRGYIQGEVVDLATDPAMPYRHTIGMCLGQEALPTTVSVDFPRAIRPGQVTNDELQLGEFIRLGVWQDLANPETFIPADSVIHVL